MSNELSIEDQKLLTEFLGDKWQEEKVYCIWKDRFFRSTAFGNEPRLSHRDKIYIGTMDECSEYVRESRLQDYEIKSVKIKRLDFSDWRVVGRLVEKVGGIIFVVYLVDKYGYGVEVDMVSNQLAICRAIVAHLKVKESINAFLAGPN